MKSENVDIVFIRPTDREAVYGRLSHSVSAVEPPLWTALLAAYARQKGLSVRIIDAEVECLDPVELAGRVEHLKPSLAVFTVIGSNLSASTWHMEGARRYLAPFAQVCPETKTLLWGLHPSALPERTLTEEPADFLCCGEGFETIVNLCRALKTGSQIEIHNICGLWCKKGRKIIQNGGSPVQQNLDLLAAPAWDLLPVDRYRAHNWHCFGRLESRRPYGVIYTSLGCPFNCTFCNLKSLFGQPGIRFRSPEKVIADIDTLVQDYEITNIKVLDECFVLRPAHVNAICDLIIERGYDLNIWAYARIDTVSKSLLEKLRLAGFTWLAFGIESAAVDVRKAVAKGQYDRSDIKRTVEMTKKAGINVLANFMFGLPDDDIESMQRTLDLAKELNCQYTNFYSTKAYPGSALYEQCLRDGVRLPDTWRGYAEFSSECLPLPTKHLTGPEVLQFRDRAFVDFHSDPLYLDMLAQTFGPSARDHMEKVLEHRIERKYTPSQPVTASQLYEE